MSRKRLSHEMRAEALYCLIKQNTPLNTVSKLCGVSEDVLRHWSKIVTEGQCYLDGGMRVESARKLQAEYNACLVRNGNQPDELPEPRLYDRRTGQVIETEHDHTASHVTPPAEDPAPETTGLREVLSLRKINAMSGRVEDLDQRVALLETTAAKWLPIIANLCSELGIEVPADEEASAWQTHC